MLAATVTVSIGPGSPDRRSSMLRHIRQILPAALAGVIVTLSIFVVCLDKSSADREAHQRSLTITGLAGSVRSAAVLAHSIWLSDDSYSTVVNLGGEKIIEIDHLTGYPSANTDGIRAVVPATIGFSEAANGTTFIFSLFEVPAVLCNVTYATGVAAGEPPYVTVRNNNNGGDCG